MTQEERIAKFMAPIEQTMNAWKFPMGSSDVVLLMIREAYKCGLNARAHGIVITRRGKAKNHALRRHRVPRVSALPKLNYN